MGLRLWEPASLAPRSQMGDKAAFLRCSVDHHNVLVMAAPVNFLHHTSWQVDDVDEVGRGAHAMLDGHPDRHIWGLGRPRRRRSWSRTTSPS